MQLTRRKNGEKGEEKDNDLCTSAVRRRIAVIHPIVQPLSP
jgi:hypothetical protein